MTRSPSPLYLSLLHDLPLVGGPSSLPSLAEVVADNGLHLVPGVGVVSARAPHVLLVVGCHDGGWRLLDLPAAVSVLSVPQATAWSDT